MCSSIRVRVRCGECLLNIVYANICWAHLYKEILKDAMYVYYRNHNVNKLVANFACIANQKYMKTRCANFRKAICDYTTG